MICPNCGADNPDTARYCRQCGKELVRSEPRPADTLPLAAAPLQPRVVAFAGFWRRFAAILIDIIPLSIIGFIIRGAFGIRPLLEWGTEKTPDFLGFGIGLITSWLYFALMESSVAQATLGKMIVGLYVTDEDGHRIQFGRATGRHFAKAISAVLLMVGFMMAGFTAKKQALHDMLAGTLVRRHTS